MNTTKNEKETFMFGFFTTKSRFIRNVIYIIGFSISMFILVGFFKSANELTGMRDVHKQINARCNPIESSMIDGKNEKDLEVIKNTNNSLAKCQKDRTDATLKYNSLIRYFMTCLFGFMILALFFN